MQQSPGSFAAGKQQLETNRLRVSEVHKANNGVLFVAYKISRFPENVQGQKSESTLWLANLANSPPPKKTGLEEDIHRFSAVGSPDFGPDLNSSISVYAPTACPEDPERGRRTGRDGSHQEMRLRPRGFFQ